MMGTVRSPDWMRTEVVTLKYRMGRKVNEKKRRNMVVAALISSGVTTCQM